jgi:hypothetical protein
MYLDVRNVVSVEKYEEENLGVNPTPRKGHHKWVDAAVLRARLNQSTTLGGVGSPSENEEHNSRCANLNEGRGHLLTDKDLFPRNRPFQSPRFRNTSTRYASNITDGSHQRAPENNGAERKKDSLRCSAPRPQIPDYESCKIFDVEDARSQISAYQRCQVENKEYDSL